MIAVGAALWVTLFHLHRIHQTDSGFSLYSSIVRGTTNKSESGLQNMEMPGAAKCRNSPTSTGVHPPPKPPLHFLMETFQRPIQAKWSETDTIHRQVVPDRHLGDRSVTF